MDRRFHMLYLLLQKGTMTASQLAEALEVSSRTIYRDMDSLSASGIPIYANQGKGGGIVLDPSFVLDKSLLDGDEQKELLTLISSLASLQGESVSPLFDKLAVLFKKEPDDWLQIDFSGWDSRDLFSIIKSSILEKKELSFNYYNSSGSFDRRTVKPVQLLFKHSQWYLWAWCKLRCDYRLFRLSRMDDLLQTDQSFQIADKKYYNFNEAELSAPLIKVKLHVSKEFAHRILDEFPRSQQEKQPDGSIIATGEFVHSSWIYSYLLSFGSHIKIIEPPFLSEYLKQEAENILKLYL